MKPGDLTPTGRRLDGPDAALVELHRDGHVWTGLVHHPRVQRAETIQATLDKAAPFLRNPMVSGLVELDAWWAQDHTLVYPTSRTWSLAELLHRGREAETSLGIKAGLELAYVGALLLQEGAEAGGEGHAPLHGDPSPWRWLLDDDGDLHLIGWGIPPLALYAHDEDPDELLPTDVYRYCPPERLKGQDEDLSTDLFALGLLVFEAIVGEPVYRGTSHAVRTAAQHADVDRRLYQARDRLPEDVRRFLGIALDPYRDARHDDVDDFVGQAHDLLYGPLTDDMPGLFDAVRTHGLRGPRLPPVPDPAAPRWSPVQRDEEPPEGPRWSRPRRARGQDRPTEPGPDPTRVAPLGPRDEATQDASEAIAEGLRESERDRDARVRARLGPRPVRPVRMLDRNALFPRLPLPDDALRYRVALPDDSSTWVRLSPTESLACSAARVVDKALPTPFDATGRLRGWFRLQQGRDGWFGDVETAVLDPEAPARLVFVPNRIVEVALTVEGAEDEPVPLEIGTAVHAAFLVSYLRQRFHLRARDWQLWAEEERPLDRWQILDDHDPPAGFPLALRRRRGRRRLQARR
jgi:hypothetical protein